MLSQLPFDIDVGRTERQFSRRAAGYCQADWLGAEVGQRLLGRLGFVKCQPRRILDLGSGPGRFSQALQQRFPQAEIIALDIAKPCLQLTGEHSLPVQAAMTQLPLADGCIDLIFANLVLCHTFDLSAVFAELARVLSEQGVLMFSSFGPDTLLELRQSFAAVSERCHVQPFLDMHDIGDQLLQKKFADPVMDVEHIHVEYGSVMQLLKEIKAAGYSQCLTGRLPGLTGKQLFAAMQQEYPRIEAGAIKASFELIFGHAFGVVPSSSSEQFTFSVDQLRQQLHNKRC